MFDQVPKKTKVDLIAKASKREQSVTSEWDLVRDLIKDVQCKEIRNVIKSNGYLTEVYRTDWKLDDTCIDQVFQVILNPGAIEAWHVHEKTTDRFFVCAGRALIVLYDAREGSPTFGQINEFRIGTERPSLLITPPGVWHGIKNIGPESLTILNLVDEAYKYESPDHWGLKKDTPNIPYSFV